MIRLTKDVSQEYADDYTAKSFQKQTDNRNFVDRLARVMNHSFSGQRILDLGAGPGQFSAIFAEMGANIVWHDISMAYRRAAESRIGANVSFVTKSMDDLSDYQDESFDFVFCRHCWYYSRDEQALYRQVRRIIKPGGGLFLSTHDNRVLSREKAGPKKVLRAIAYYLHEKTGLKCIPVPADPGRLKRWLFGTHDFSLLDEGRSEIAFWVLGRRKSERKGIRTGSHD